MTFAPYDIETARSGFRRSCDGRIHERSMTAWPLMHEAHRFSIAPMMDWTDRHCRFFHRLLTRRALIYTEMVTTGAVLHGDRARLIGFDNGIAAVGATDRGGERLLGGGCCWGLRGRGSCVGISVALRAWRRASEGEREEDEREDVLGA